MLFLSYSTKDKEEALEICAYLDEAHIEYWRDEERLDGEDNWLSQISHAMHQCTSFLILLSRHVSKAPDQLVQELTIANGLQRRGMRIFGISLDGDRFWEQPGSFEYVLKAQKVFDCSSGACEEIQKIVSSIRSWEKLHGKPIDPMLEAAHEAVSSVDAVSKEFLGFTSRVLGELYLSYECRTPDARSNKLASYAGQIFPDIAIPASAEVRPFDLEEFVPALQSRSTLDFAHHPKELPVEQSIAAQVANFYSKVFVNYPCYMNKQMHLNEAGQITSIEMFTGTRKQNVMTTSTLRNEFYLAYSKLKAEGRLQNATLEEVMELCPRRMYVMEQCGNGLASLLKGAAGYSEFGIQGIVLMRISPTRKDGGLYTFRRHAGEYWTPLLLRSSIVEEQPGFYQFAPCGGFGILQSAKSEVLRLLAIEGFDYYNALMFRFCDELFAEPSHARDVAKTTAAPAKDSRRTLLRNADKLNDNDQYVEMFNLIEAGKATIEFLGVSSSLVSLKSDLVFALVIDDPDYYVRNRDKFHASRETVGNLMFRPISMLLDEEGVEAPMAEELSAPLELLRRSDIVSRLNQ